MPRGTKHYLNLPNGKYTYILLLNLELCSKCKLKSRKKKKKKSATHRSSKNKKLNRLFSKYNALFEFLLNLKAVINFLK